LKYLHKKKSREYLKNKKCKGDNDAMRIKKKSFSLTDE